MYMPEVGNFDLVLRGGITLPTAGETLEGVLTSILVTNSRITVTGNKATNVIAGGGKAGIKVGEISMEGVANVNSVNITGSKIRNSEITVSNNEATDIKAINCFSQSGTTVSLVARERPAVPIIALTPLVTTARRMATLRTDTSPTSARLIARVTQRNPPPTRSSLT